MASGSVVAEGSAVGASVVGPMVDVDIGLAVVSSGPASGSNPTSRVPHPAKNTTENRRNSQILFLKRKRLKLIMFNSCNKDFTKLIRVLLSPRNVRKYPLREPCYNAIGAQGGADMDKPVNVILAGIAVFIGVFVVFAIFIRAIIGRHAFFAGFLSWLISMMIFLVLIYLFAPLALGGGDGDGEGVIALIILLIYSLILSLIFSFGIGLVVYIHYLCRNHSETRSSEFMI
jgi:hypothetical protein